MESNGLLNALEEFPENRDDYLVVTFIDYGAGKQNGSLTYLHIVWHHEA